MSEARFVISHNFTTIRGDSYDEFIQNLASVYGEEDAKSLATVAFTELRNRFLNAPTLSEAQQNLSSGLGATPAPAHTPTASASDWVALDIPFSKKDYAKQNGGRWDKEKRAWTFPAGHALIAQFPVKA